MKKIILFHFFCLPFVFVNAQWTTSGNNIFTTNSGNVGIGTSNPQYRLHLFDNSSNQLPSLVLDGQNGMQAGFFLIGWCLHQPKHLSTQHLQSMLLIAFTKI